MKVIVAGSRTIKDYTVVEKAILESGWLDDEIEIVSGMADGVDMLAVTFANLNKLPVHRFPADWRKYGRSAGHIRNREMAQFADALIAVWDGVSKGTKSMIDLARLHGLKTIIVELSHECG